MGLQRVQATDRHDGNDQQNNQAEDGDADAPTRPPERLPDLFVEVEAFRGRFADHRALTQPMEARAAPHVELIQISRRSGGRGARLAETADDLALSSQDRDHRGILTQAQIARAQTSIPHPQSESPIRKSPNPKSRLADLHPSLNHGFDCRFAIRDSRFWIGDSRSGIGDCSSRMRYDAGPWQRLPARLPVPLLDLSDSGPPSRS
jgi:hypothetical protein